VFVKLNSPCDEMHSEYMQNKYFVETLGMTEPQQVEIGQTEIVCFGDNGMEPTVVERYSYIVPFLPALCKLISCPDVLTEVKKYGVNQGPFAYDVCDGNFVQNHPLALKDSKFLHIMLFTDDLEICNPIGSHAKNHKITMFYWSLLNVPPVYRSRLSYIQLLAAAKTSHIKQFGMEKILSDFPSAMNEMAIGIDLPGLGLTTGGLVVVVADTPAANLIGGFKEGVGFAKRKCCTCNCDANQMASFFKEKEFDIRTHKEHVERCATLSLLSERSRTYWCREYGINGSSPLLDIPHFDISKCLVHDAMHVLFEGVVPFEVKLALKHFTSDQVFCCNVC
jgi:hypothetical protein